ALSHRGGRRRLERRGGDVPDLLLLAGVGAVGDRRAAPGRAPVRAAALLFLAAGAVRRGARGLIGAPPWQLPAGVHAPGPDQRSYARDRGAAGELRLSTRARREGAPGRSRPRLGPAAGSVAP